MSAPAIPAGYRRLKVGEKRPPGYGFYCVNAGCFEAGSFLLVGKPIEPSDITENHGPYIAPVRKARKEGGKR